MATEREVHYTYRCPEDERPTWLYTQAEYNAIKPGTPLRQVEPCPNCGKVHRFTKKDLERVGPGQTPD